MAARYARADAAKVLLDAGADCNAEDITGRTPLHAAIAADALGVFQVSHDKSDGICFTVCFKASDFINVHWFSQV